MGRSQDARRSAPLLLAWALAAVFATAARGSVVEGVSFEPELRALGERFVLQNAAVLRWKILFKPYVAALYRGEETSPGDVLKPGRARRLEIHYFYGISARDFRRATDELMRRNVGADRLERLRPQIAALNDLYRDVEPGDRYALTFVPGHGTELALNGGVLGVIPGDEFGDMVHRMWLGEKPADAALRDALLRGS